MGRSVTPTYEARYRDQDGWHSIAWSGRVSPEKVEEKRVSLNASFLPGGVNEHVRTSQNGIPHISCFRVHPNGDRTVVVAEANAPAFETF